MVTPWASSKLGVWEKHKSQLWPKLFNHYFGLPEGPVHMSRSYLSYQENILTSLQAKSRPVMKWYEKSHYIDMRRNVLPDTEILLADRRDLGDPDNFCLIWTQLSRLAGKLSVYTLQNLHHSGKLYQASSKTFAHMNRTKLFDLSKCFLREITSVYMNRP